MKEKGQEGGFRVHVSKCSSSLTLHMAGLSHLWLTSSLADFLMDHFIVWSRALAPARKRAAGSPASIPHIVKGKSLPAILMFVQVWSVADSVS